MLLNLNLIIWAIMWRTLRQVVIGWIDWMLSKLLYKTYAKLNNILSGQLDVEDRQCCNNIHLGGLQESIEYRNWDQTAQQLFAILLDDPNLNQLN